MISRPALQSRCRTAGRNFRAKNSRKASEAFALPISRRSPIDDVFERHETPAGFRHFLGTPKPSQRFKAYGVDPLDAPEQSEKIRGLMNRLSRRMDAQISWPAHDDAAFERWENPRPSLGLHLSAAICRPRSRSDGDAAFGHRQAWRRDRECAPHPAQAGNPVRKRSGRLSFYLRAGYAERRPPHQTAARPHAPAGQGRRARLSVPRHRANTGRECHRDRPQHSGHTRCAHRSAGRRSPQRRSRHHVATDRPVFADA